MLCPKCKKEIVDGSKFCGFCGDSFDETVCEKCGAKNLLDHNFCKSCGSPINKTVKVDFPAVDKKENKKSKVKVAKCPGCGAEATSESVYCDNCGLNLARYWKCSECGTTLRWEGNESKCPNCGCEFEDSEQKDAHQKENIKKEEDGGWGTFCTLGLMFCILSFFIAPYIFGAIGIAVGVLGISKEKSLGGLLIIIACAISIFLSYQATAKLQSDLLQQSQQMLQQHQEWKKSIGLK